MPNSRPSGTGSSGSGLSGAGPAMIGPGELTELLVAAGTDGAEVALLDAREQGAFSRRHLLLAANVPLSHLELRLERLVPRRSTTIVWCDGGSGDDLAVRAAARCRALGWTAAAVLDGGVDGWEAAGGEVYSGVNVPSKAMGELIEQRHQTPHLAPTELARLREEGRRLVVLDARPFDEYRRRAIPGGVDCPGAELVHRVRDAAPDPDTLVVVNCAGRTRSIIGAQSLINAGLPNPVVALENGTMGWELAGFEVERGASELASAPSVAARAWAATAAAGVAERFGVRTVAAEALARLLDEPDRTTYLLDVRTVEEFEAGHLAGSLSAPGGQLVQATDTWVAVNGARIVLVDDDGVRATMTASWLRQLGWTDTMVVADGVDGVAGKVDHRLLGMASGPSPRPGSARVRAPVIRPSALAELLAEGPGAVTVLDVGTSHKYAARGHIAGAWWGVRARLDEARAAIGDTRRLVLTSTDGALAKLTVAEAAALWPEAEVLALAGGNKGWRHAGHDMEPGTERVTTAMDDIWSAPYEQDDAHAAARAYIEWEIALVAQVERDRTARFRVEL